jgi:hypothetical protein
MKWLKFAAGDEVFAILHFLSRDPQPPRIFRARVEEFRHENDMYVITVHAHNGVRHLIAEENLLTYEEAVARRLAGKVR